MTEYAIQSSSPAIGKHGVYRIEDRKRAEAAIPDAEGYKGSWSFQRVFNSLAEAESCRDSLNQA